MSLRPLMTPVLLAMLLLMSGCDPNLKRGGTGEGSFCRIYEPVPPSEGSGVTIQRNEIAYCVLCAQDCPEIVVDAWKRRR